MADQQLDIVYTWVKGEDPDYRRMVAQYSGKPQHANPERYRDQFDLLRYSLRSVEKNFPSYRYLYLVTMRPQLPDWLNIKNPRLRIVHHDELFPSAEFLPTFNHNTIESYLHLLPEIADRFVYMNDDFLFGVPTSLSDLFPRGKPAIFGSLFGEILKFRIYDGTWLSLGFIEHCPVPILKSAWAEMQTIVHEEVFATRRGKFRENYHIRMDRLYTWFMLKYRRSECEIRPFWETKRLSRFVRIRNNEALEMKSIAKLQRSPRNFVCLNDDQGDSPNQAVIEQYRSFLSGLFPEASPYEV